MEVVKIEIRWVRPFTTSFTSCFSCSWNTVEMFTSYQSWCISPQCPPGWWSCWPLPLPAEVWQIPAGYFYRDLQPAKVSSCLSDSLVIPGKDDQCWWWWCRCSGWNFPPRVSDYHTSARSASHYLPSLSRSAKLVTIIFESASTMIVVKIVRRGICCQWVDLLG